MASEVMVTRHSSSAIEDLVNFILVPLRLLIPQPIVARIPVLRTNEDERITRVLRELAGRALDIGCGRNLLMRRYRALGSNGTGVDVFDWGGPDLVVSDAACLPFENRSFDCITFVACINHIPNRNAVLSEARRLLKADGRVIVTNLTPMISRLWHRLAFWDDDQHVRGMKDGEVWGFTERELTEIMKGAEFALARKKSFMWGLNHLYVFVPAKRADQPDS